MSDPRPDLLTRRQLAALGWMGAISPLFWHLPDALMAPAGRAAWLSVLLSSLPLGLTAVFLGAFLRRRRPGEGLAELFFRALGPVPGRVVVFIYTIWILFLAGYALRAGADRFVSAVYPYSEPGAFILVLLGLSLLAGLGRAKTLARFAEVTLPVLAGMFALVFLLALGEVEVDNLLPVSRLDLPGAAFGTIAVTNTLSIVLYTAFLEDRTQPGDARGPLLKVFGWLLALALLLCVTTVGRFGAELTGALNYPFFVLIRDVRVLNLLERVEALIVAQWVITDFLLVAMLLQIGRSTLRLAFYGPGAEPRRWLALPGAAFALVSAFLCAPTVFDLQRMMTQIVPGLNIIMVFIGLPVIFLIGRIRGRI